VQLTHLKVRNIRSYASADLTLGPGTSLLVGDVGAGKTSLLYAIEMALFGFAEVDPVHLIRHRSREAEVVLGLSDGEHVYELRRRFSRKHRKGKEVFEADECLYGADGAVQKYSPTELRQRAIDLLGFPDNPNPRAHSDLWRWAVYIPQERMRDVLSQEPTERRETVRKALGLEQYKVAADNALLLARDIATRARSLEDRAEMLLHFEEDFGRWTAERDRTLVHLEELRTAAVAAQVLRREAEVAVEEAERAARALAVDRASLQQLIEQIEERSARLAALERSREEALRRREELGEELTKLQRQIAQRTPLEDARGAARVEVERRSAIDAQREALARERAAAETGFETARAAVERAQLELRRTETEARAAEQRAQAAEALPPIQEPSPPTDRTLQEIDADRAAARSEVEAAQAEVAARRPVLEDLESLLASGNCPRCHQRVEPGAFGPHRDEARAAVASSSAQLTEARRRWERLERERTDREAYERDHTAWTRAEETRREARRQAAEGSDRELRARHAVEAAEAQRRATESARAAAPSLPASEAEDRRALSDARARLEAAELAVAAVARAEDRRTALGERAQELEAEGVERESELERFRTALRDAERDRTALGERLAGRDADRGLEDARIHARAATERAETLGREIARRETELTSWTGRLREAEAGRARRGQLLAQAGGERALATFLQGPFRDALTELEERLLQRAQREFERTFARAFQTLVEDPTISARTDGAFTPAVEIDGEWTPAEALSGGERTALALSFRIALGQVIRGAGRLKLSTLILDEPTDGFSPEQVIRVGELLSDLGLPQVILVSHETGLAAVADRVFRVAKVEGLSVVRSEESSAPEVARPPSPRESSGGPDRPMPAE
jgi:exonuclease SbcC